MFSNSNLSKILEEREDMILITSMAGFKDKNNVFTGKSLSEAQYDDRLFIEFRV